MDRKSHRDLFLVLPAGATVRGIPEQGSLCCGSCGGFRSGYRKTTLPAEEHLAWLRFDAAEDYASTIMVRAFSTETFPKPALRNSLEATFGDCDISWVATDPLPGGSASTGQRALLVPLVPNRQLQPPSGTNAWHVRHCEITRSAGAEGCRTAQNAQTIRQ
jgi:hypothetical protein